MKPRFILCLFALSLTLYPPVARAQWGNVFNGTAISTGTGNQFSAVSVSDGAGGAIIAWADNRNGNYDIFAQRVNAWGQVQWTGNGVPVRVALNNQTNPAIVSDGAQGAVIFWEHLANNGSTDIQAQRLNAAGAQMWLNPTTICGAQHDQSSPRAVAATGGTIVVWQDNRQGSTMQADVYAQRVDMSGVNQWTSDGVAICTATQKQTNARIVGDGIGSGGAIIAWTDFRDSSTYSVYARRIDNTGLVQWTADGVLLGPDTGTEVVPAIASDGANGAIVTWHSDTDGDNDIYAQRINSSGAVQWTPGGVGVCTAIESQIQPQIAPDASGGAIVTWQDLRNTVTFFDEDVYAQRINASGAAQWTADGVALCTEDGASTQPQIIPDGAGGAVVVWPDTRLLGYDLYAQRVNAAGTVLWTTNGAEVILANAAQTGPAPVPDGFGGMIVAWNDNRNANFDVYANRITGGGIIPTPVRDTPVVPSIGVNIYPNPSSASTTIDITSDREAPVTVDVFDVSGRRVRSWNVGRVDAPTRTIPFDGRDQRGQLLPSGLYFCRVRAGSATIARKLLIQR